MEESSNSVMFTWKIANFSNLGDTELYSDHFDAGGYKWRLSANPKGYNGKSLSIFLHVTNTETLPAGWSRDAKISFSVINEVIKCTTIKETERTFSANRQMWGFHSIVPLVELYDASLPFLDNNVCTVKVKLSLPEDPVKEENNSFPYAEMDSLFTNIRNFLEPSTPKGKNSSNFCAIEIAEAEEIFNRCLNMDVLSVIQSGKVPELKNSLSILLTTNVFSKKIVAEFVKGCEKYEIARQDLIETMENESSVVEIKSSLKQLYSEFTSSRSLAEAVDQEIAKLGKQASGWVALKDELKRKLEDLTIRAKASKEALVCAEKKMQLSTMKREQAEKTIKGFDQLWEFFKVFRTPRA